MDNSFIFSQSKLPFKKYRINYSIKNICNNNKSFISKKLFHSLKNIQINNSISNKNSTINSISNSGTSSQNPKNKKNYKTELNSKNKKNNLHINNEKVFEYVKIKPKRNFHFKKNKSKSQDFVKNKNFYFKTENNHKLIFNNIGVYYQYEKNNGQLNDEKEELYYKKQNKLLKKGINRLIKQNKNMENEKIEKENKIENLEKKLNELTTFIKNNNLIDLKNKINSLEHLVDYLKKENGQLKKEIDKKNRIFLCLSNNKLNKSIGKKKENNCIKNINNNINLNTNENINRILNNKDMEKIRLISIEPDNF